MDRIYPFRSIATGLFLLTSARFFFAPQTQAQLRSLLVRSIDTLNLSSGLPCFLTHPAHVAVLEREGERERERERERESGPLLSNPSLGGTVAKSWPWGLSQPVGINEDKGPPRERKKPKDERKETARPYNQIGSLEAILEFQYYVLARL